MVLYLASDLLWATRIKSCAEDLGIPARPVRNLEMLAARLADSPVRGVLLDLAAGEEGHEGEIAFAMLGRLKGGVHHRGTEATEKGMGEGRGKPGGAQVEAGIRVVVFGPHVQAADLAAAKKAGADVMMARGALAANLPRVLMQLAQREGGPGLHDQLEE